MHCIEQYDFIVCMCIVRVLENHDSVLTMSWKICLKKLYEPCDINLKISGAPIEDIESISELKLANLSFYFDGNNLS